MADCFVGATTGCFKAVSFKESKITNVNRIAELVPKEDEITAMCFGDAEQTEIVVAQANHKIKLYNTLTDLYTNLFTATAGTGHIKGLAMLESGNIQTVVASGEIRTWSPEGKLLSSEDWSAGEGILSYAKKPNAGIIATGGKNNIVKTWDIETEKQIWHAKNVRNNFLGLPIPIWETGIKFLNENELATVTGTGHVRVYDARTQRRPVRELKYLDSPITAISMCNRPNHIVAGNTTGDVSLFDLRADTAKVYLKLKGFAGSVRSVDAHPTEPWVVSVGIDRHVRLHSLDVKGKPIKKLYAKVRLNCVLLKEKNECAMAKADK
uniref:WD_REPEATS_REGION domain-containing protein n=1 Tax=Panagrellus redivivus TaxID=6233 RepID=A0A7E4VJT2_PANRE